jgi:2,4-dienoyl-CoA reductase-like NADH-dependent reductase (Old Yellow Enzyme family)
MSMTTTETNLFTPHSLQGMPLRNRLIRSATMEGMCGTDGQPQKALFDLYRQLAAGGCGLVISGPTYVAEERTGPQKGMWPAAFGPLGDQG